KHLYLQGARLAGWRDDWAGLLAAACGIKNLERERGPYSSTNALLLRAMVVAEKKQSQSGLVAVAKAFAVLGENKVASMVLSRIGKDWVDETNDSVDIVSTGCGNKKNKNSYVELDSIRFCCLIRSPCISSWPGTAKNSTATLRERARIIPKPR